MEWELEFMPSPWVPGQVRAEGTNNIFDRHGTTFAPFLTSRSTALPSPLMARPCSQPQTMAVCMYGRQGAGGCYGEWQATEVGLGHLNPILVT